MILIHHDQDLDGLACRAIFEMKFPDAVIYGWDYKYDPQALIEMIDEQKDETRIMMADVTLPPEYMAYLNEEYDLTVIDHHVTAYNDLRDLDIDYVYGEKAACELLWKYLYDSNTPEIISILGAYDTWRGEGTGYWSRIVLPVQLYLRMKWNESVEMIKKFIKAPEAIDDRCISKGLNLIEFEKSQFEASARQMFPVKIQGEEFMAVNATLNPGRFMNYVRDHYGYLRIVVYYQSPDRRWKYSLRSVARVYIDHIAKFYGGGGHPQAAGFSHDKLIF